VAHQIARADAVTAAAEVHKAENKRLYRQHCKARTAIEEWRMALRHTWTGLADQKCEPSTVR
jgi:hypothetical protein